MLEKILTPETIIIYITNKVDSYNLYFFNSKMYFYYSFFTCFSTLTVYQMTLYQIIVYWITFDLTMQVFMIETYIFFFNYNYYHKNSCEKLLCFYHAFSINCSLINFFLLNCHLMNCWFIICYCIIFNMVSQKIFITYMNILFH